MVSSCLLKSLSAPVLPKCELTGRVGADSSENELWYGIAGACIRQYHFVPGRRLTDGGRNGSFSFVMLGRLANLIPVHTRYVPYIVLYRALVCEYPVPSLSV